MKELIDSFDHDEKLILFNEFKRDYDSYDSLKDVSEIITISISSLSILVAILAIFFDKIPDNIFNLTNYFGLLHSSLAVFLLPVVVAITSFTIVKNYRGSNLVRTKYILSIFEELDL